MKDIQGLLNDLDSVRARIAHLKGQLSTIESQTVSRSDLGDMIGKQVATWHARALDQVSGEIGQLVAGHGGGFMVAAVKGGGIDMGPWLAVAMGPEKLNAWLLPMLEQIPEGLDAKTRVKRMGEIRFALDQAGIEEEALLREAEELSCPIDPRPDADPRAALLLMNHHDH